MVSATRFHPVGLSAFYFISIRSCWCQDCGFCSCFEERGDLYHSKTVDSAPASKNEAIYIIQFAGDPLATYKGTTPGFAATNPGAAGTRKLEYDSATSQKYITHLRQQRQNKISLIEAATGRPVTIIHHYDTAFNGIAVRLSGTEATTVATLSGILRVEKDREIKNSRNSTGGTSHTASVTGIALNHSLFIPALLLTFTLMWAAWRRKISSWRWVLASTSLVILTTACSGGDSHNEIRLESPDGVSCSPGAAWIGAPGVWDGSSTDGLPATMGEGIVIGIIDSGISPHSPSFAALGDDGYEHHNPRGKYYGVCDPDNAELYNPNFPCNEKLIGA
ncbi:MAG: protease inhibitor I9 family protein, partial [Deltaproteobacteria bacterium]|nr:protease inhibitor I9 family protein [Deltaproteobacteria bacterium]